MKSKSILLIIAFFVSLLGCESRRLESVPAELIGVWKTSAPKYEYCSFELTKDYIIFINGHFAEHTDVNFIVKAERVPERRHFLYTIHYENLHGQKYKFGFYHYPLKDGVIRFKNQKFIEWKKVRSIKY
jgi:hypothetical protein